MIEAVEAAIMARLRAGVPALQDVTSYQGEDVADAIAHQLLNMPSVTVVFTGGRWNTAGTGTYRREGVFQLLIATRNFRSEEARRTGGSTEEMGSYELLEAIEGTLVGQALGLNIEPLEPKETANLWTAELESGGYSVYGLELSTVWSVSATPEDGEALTSLHGSYGLEGGEKESGTGDILEW